MIKSFNTQKFRMNEHRLETKMVNISRKKSFHFDWYRSICARFFFCLYGSLLTRETSKKKYQCRTPRGSKERNNNNNQTSSLMITSSHHSLHPVHSSNQLQQPEAVCPNAIWLQPYIHIVTFSIFFPTNQDHRLVNRAVIGETLAHYCGPTNNTVACDRALWLFYYSCSSVNKKKKKREL